MGDGIKEVKTSQGVIKYQPKEDSKDASFEYKEKDGYVHIKAKDVSIYLPENTASKIITGGGNSIFNKLSGGFYGNSSNIDIIDGAENDGNNYSDRIMLYGDNVSYNAARKTVGGKAKWAEDSSKGDEIVAMDGKNMNIYARSGNNVFVTADAQNVNIEAYQGTHVKDGGLTTNVTVKSSPHTKGDNARTGVTVEGTHFTQVNAEKGTIIDTNGTPMVTNHKGELMNESDEDRRFYNQ